MRHKRNYLSEKDVRRSLTRRLNSFKDVSSPKWPYVEGDGEKIVKLAVQKRLTVEEWRVISTHHLPSSKHQGLEAAELATLIGGLPAWSDDPGEMAVRFALIYGTVLQREYLRDDENCHFMSRYDRAAQRAMHRIQEVNKHVFAYCTPNCLNMDSLLWVQKSEERRKRK